MDRLRPEEQLTLKVASVLGLTIYRQLLQVRGRGAGSCGHGLIRHGLRRAAGRVHRTLHSQGAPLLPAFGPPPAQATHPQHHSLAAVEASLCALESASFLRQDPLDAATWRFCQVPSAATVLLLLGLPPAC